MNSQKIILAQSSFLGGVQDPPRNRASRGEIFVMDEDIAMRETLSIALQEEGYDVVCFADSTALLAVARERTPACMFIEVRNPDQAGLELLKKLRAENYPAPIFIISGHGDIPMAVAAIRHGALDFIEKPFRSDDVVARLKVAMGELSRWQQAETRSKLPALQFPGCEPLTKREQQVLERLAAGVSNKEAARQLGLSARTVEGHRANIMKKVGVKNAAQLFRLVLGER